MASDPIFVLPGDILQPKYTNNLKLGPGLHQIQTSEAQAPPIIATRAGNLKTQGRNKYFVDSNGHRVG